MRVASGAVVCGTRTALGSHGAKKVSEFQSRRVARPALLSIIVHTHTLDFFGCSTRSGSSPRRSFRLSRGFLCATSSIDSRFRRMLQRTARSSDFCLSLPHLAPLDPSFASSHCCRLCPCMRRFRATPVVLPAHAARRNAGSCGRRVIVGRSSSPLSGGRGLHV